MNITTDKPNAAKIGEYVKHKKLIRKIIGYAIGEDGRDCYVSMSANDEYGWRTHLTPMDEVTDKYVRVSLDGDA